MDDFIDVIMGNRAYLPCLYVYNKVDQVSMEEVNRLAHLPHSVVCSAYLKLNLDYVLEQLWDCLALIRVYTKKPGQAPDIGAKDGIILRNGSTVLDLCRTIHKTLASELKYAIVWGTSPKYTPQRVSGKHVLEHEDVIQIMKK